MDPRSTTTPDATAPELVFVAGEDWADDVVRKTPWWAFSIAFHLAVLLVFALVAFDVSSHQPDPPSGFIRPPVEPRPQTSFKKPSEKEQEPFVRTQETSEEIQKFIPNAELDDYNAQDIDKTFRETAGNHDFESPSKIPQKGFIDTIGTGGGGGGGGLKGRGHNRNVMARGQPEQKKRFDSTLAGLRWLARHQNPDGHWDTDGFSADCGRVIRGSCGGPGYPEYDAGNTGLALLAFLGAGYTHLSRDVYDGIRFGDVVKRGLQWLMVNQDAEGCVGGRSASKYLYNHAIAALALSEAYGLTGSGLFKQEAQKSIDFLVSARNAGTGWRYTARCGDNDTSVTGWCVMALKSAELSGLDVPRSAYEGARAWLDEATDADGRTGYNARGTGQVVVAGRNEHFADHPAMTAIALMSRIFIDRHRNDPRHQVAAGLLARDVPVWDGPRIDYYYWYYAALALFQYDGAEGRTWKAWGGAMDRVLCDNQRKAKDGCVHGSWDPIDRWGFEGGRVYATAINTLSLEVWYRYESVFNPGK